MVPIILFDTPLEVFENVRAVALSVVGILCQAREPKIIQWAIESNMVEVCQFSVENGNELSKVIGMHILEAVLQDEAGLSYICSPMCHQVLMRLMKTFQRMVSLLIVDHDFSPRLLFHIIRCYLLLCTHARGFSVVMENLPHSIINGSFTEITEEFPVIGSLIEELLLTLDKDDNCLLSLPDELILD